MSELFGDKYRISSTRLPNRNYSEPGYYFVTICTKERFPRFGDIQDGKMILNDNGKIVQETWLTITKHFNNVRLDEFVVMPDHVHGILFLKNVDQGCVETTYRASRERVPKNIDDNGNETSHGTSLRPKYLKNSLSSIINQYKGTVTRKINKQIADKFARQSRFYESVVRDEKQLFFAQEYIKKNPFNRGKKEKSQFMPS